ncbi:Down syndrome cell adhesion molecule-like protein Dscam2 [Limulus polyphemus]|uniref:Down syndrome cell adhesion molecule-like protein Dscam2 n=1 Tax=Limulus polyphemus TaxID=6850 RepID=A0ABM1TIE6_LIMPO|nr:Down syndrome cell adhesion molecule-like protein Dscam2 [Limulus polyphemus]
MVQVLPINYNSQLVMVQELSRNYNYQLVMVQVLSRNYNYQLVMVQVLSRNYNYQLVMFKNYNSQLVIVQVLSRNYNYQLVMVQELSKNYNSQLVMVLVLSRNYNYQLVMFKNYNSQLVMVQVLSRNYNSQLVMVQELSFKLQFSAGLEPSEDISPAIMDSRPKVTVKVKETALIPCAGQGHPPPQHTWYREKGSEWILATSWPRARQVEGTLWVDDVQIEDEGHYHCVINNTLGKKAVQTILTVSAPLKVRIEPHSLVMLTGGTATLTCVVSGHPVDSIVWMKNFQSLEPDGRTYFRSRKVLHIKAVTRSDQGMYQCFVFSNGNSVQGTAQLVVSGRSM